MKRMLRAIAVTGAFAAPSLGWAASGNFEVSGWFVAGAERNGISGHAVENRVSDGGSRIIFTFTTPISGNFKAWGQCDQRLFVDTAASQTGTAPTAASTFICNGNTGVGLLGDFGKFMIGRWNQHFVEQDVLMPYRFNPAQAYHGEGLMSQVNGQTIAAAGRTQNLLAYDTNSIAGFTAHLGYSTAPGISGTGTEGNNTATSKNDGGYAATAALRYSDKGIVAGVSYWKALQENRNTASTPNSLAAVSYATWDQKSLKAWAGYRFPFGLMVGAGYDQSQMSTVALDPSVTAKRSAWMVPVSWISGAHGGYFTYARAGNVTGDPTYTADSGAKLLSVTYEYAFSKDAGVNVTWTKIKNDAQGSYDITLSNATSGATGTTANVTAGSEGVNWLWVGLKYSF